MEGQFPVVINGSRYSWKNHHTKANTTHENHHYITFLKELP